jgi:hypothetical protein
MTQIAQWSDDFSRGTNPRFQPEENDECCQDCLFANIAHLGWAIGDLYTTIKNFEDLGLGPWRRYILGRSGRWA